MPSLDRTYCTSFRGCRHGPTCDKALTGVVIAAADKAGMRASMIRTATFLGEGCFESIETKQEDG